MHVHIDVHVYRLGFVKPCYNEMDEVILRRIFSDIINKERNIKQIMPSLSKSPFTNTSS
jgi:hypothetical protein